MFVVNMIVSSSVYVLLKHPKISSMQNQKQLLRPQDKLNQEGSSVSDEVLPE